MFEQAQLAEQFNTLLAREREAAQHYAAMADHVDDPELRKQVLQLHSEKKRHIRLARRLLEIVD